jgi:hypothetical protein
MSAEPVDPKQLVDAICGPSPKYKREAVDAIVAHQEQTTPYLLALLSEMAADPEGYLSRVGADDFDPLYTVVLLAHFREARSHDDLVRIARLPPETFERLIGGFAAEGFDEVLLATAGDRTAGLHALLADHYADEFVRSQAAHALAVMVHRGHAQRDEVLSLLAGLLNEEAAPQAVDFFWSGVIEAMLRLHPVEHTDAMRRAFDEGLVPDGMMGFDYVEERLARGPQDDDDVLERPAPPDVHGWLSWWACFDERLRAPPPAPKPQEPARQAPGPPRSRKLARNGPCWCGSGRKYKGCHYKSDQAGR